MRLFALVVSASLALSAVACSANVDGGNGDDATLEESEADIVSAQKDGCGAKYTPALRKYELAVIAAKAVKARKVCEPVSNPKDRAEVEATQEAVGELLQEAVGTCSAFRDVYKNSPYAAPARDVLATSLLGDVVSGAVDTKTFAGLEKALVGKKMYGPKPGIMNLFDVTFEANGKATFSAYDWDKEADVKTQATWTAKTIGGKTEVTITQDGKTTKYTPKLEYGHVVLAPVGEGSPISTSSDPCSA